MSLSVVGKVADRSSCTCRTTVLLGAFLAGLTLNVMPSSSAAAIQSATKLGEEETSDAVEVLDFKKTYAEYIEVVQNYVGNQVLALSERLLTRKLASQILVPLFFSSIGFTIPFLSLWSGRIIWRGIVYSILMTLGKVLVGIVVLVVDSFAHPVDSAGSTLTENELNGLDLATKDFQEHQRRNKVQKRARKLQQLKTESLPAAGFLGIALVARGEIGVRPPSFFPLSSHLPLTTDVLPSRSWSYKSRTGTEDHESWVPRRTCWGFGQRRCVRLLDLLGSVGWRGSMGAGSGMGGGESLRWSEDAGAWLRNSDGDGFVAKEELERKRFEYI